MSDPTANASLPDHADRLRAPENEGAAERRGRDDGFEGIREYSRAWHEDRSTAYLLRKSWADPVNRWFIVAVVTIITIGWAYLLTQ